ncbi:MAG: hypothetical protein ACYCY9_03620 [Thiobacillus sp.]
MKARVAGVRTYGLMGLLGGGTALPGEPLGTLTGGIAFAALAGVLTTVYGVNFDRGYESVGITRLIAGLLTFVLGALAEAGRIEGCGLAARRWCHRDGQPGLSAGCLVRVG